MPFNDNYKLTKEQIQKAINQLRNNPSHPLEVVIHPDAKKDLIDLDSHMESYQKVLDYDYIVAKNKWDRYFDGEREKE